VSDPIAAVGRQERLVCYQIAHDYTSVWQWAEFMKILVPVDGSPASIRAVKPAIDQVKGTARNRPRSPERAEFFRAQVA
jgi:hypothetical protein